MFRQWLNYSCQFYPMQGIVGLFFWVNFFYIHAIGIRSIFNGRSEISIIDSMRS